MDSQNYSFAGIDEHGRKMTFETFEESADEDADEDECHQCQIPDGPAGNSEVFVRYHCAPLTFQLKGAEGSRSEGEKAEEPERDGVRGTENKCRAVVDDGRPGEAERDGVRRAKNKCRAVAHDDRPEELERDGVREKRNKCQAVAHVGRPEELKPNDEDDDEDEDEDGGQRAEKVERQKAYLCTQILPQKTFAKQNPPERILPRKPFGKFGQKEFYIENLESARADREIVTKAVEQNGNALMYAAEPLKADIEIVNRALEQDQSESRLHKSRQKAKTRFAAPNACCSDQGCKTLNPLTIVPISGSACSVSEEEFVEVEMMVDSGATETVMSEKCLDGVIEISEGAAFKRGQHYECANGSQIPNLGERKFLGITEEQGRKAVAAQVCAVTKNLLSVKGMTRNGHRVVFD